MQGKDRREEGKRVMRAEKNIMGERIEEKKVKTNERNKWERKMKKKIVT
jgi:hypothetical protein